MMMTKEERLFCVEVQMQKTVSLLDHGDNPGAIMAIVDAIRTLAAIQKESEPELEAFLRKWDLERDAQKSGLEVKAPDPETRAALDSLRTEPTKIKRK
jgi:hypothetical protein